MARKVQIEPLPDIRFSEKQQLALWLSEAGYGPTAIAAEMGLKSRKSASRLLRRARQNEAAIRRLCSERAW